MQLLPDVGYQGSVGLVVEQRVDEGVVELVDERGGHVGTLAIGFARLGVDVVAADGVYLVWLSGQLAAGTVVAAAAGETDDDAEAVGGGGAVEAGVPLLVEVSHDAGLIGFQALVVERAVLLEEVVEAGICVEHVELVDEVVDVNITPTLFEVGLFAKEFDLPIVDVEVDGHAHHCIVTDGMLVAQALETGNGGVLLVRCKPDLGVLGVLSRHVHVVLLVARRACEDTHEFDGLADLYSDLTFSLPLLRLGRSDESVALLSLLHRLRCRGQCQKGEEDNCDDIFLHCRFRL